MLVVPQAIYLASKSPRRRELLKQIGVRYELLLLREQNERRDVDEAARLDEAPVDYVERVVRLKIAAAERIIKARRLTPRPILAADTTVALDNEIFSKPANAKEAHSMLSRLQGRTHRVLTGIAVCSDGETHYALSTSEVTFAALSEAEIKRYADSTEPLDKAGGYGIQGTAARFIARIDGSYSGVMGLPLYETATLLRQSGVSI